MSNTKLCLKISRAVVRTHAAFAFATLIVLSTSLITHAQQPAVLGNGGTAGATGTEVMTGIAGTFVIRNARIVTVSGAEIPNGSIVISNGKIAAVGGAEVQAPGEATEINAQGLSVYPGMMDAGTSLGLVEVGQGASGTVDTAEVGDMNPNAQAIIAVNPHSAHVGVTRVNGVTNVVTAPRGSTIAGQSAVINLLGTTSRDMAVVPNAALVVNFPRLTASGRGAEFFVAQQQTPDITTATTARDRQVEQFRKMLRDAEAYGKAQDAYASDPRLPRPDVNVVLASLVPYVRGVRPVIFNVDRAVDIRAAVRFADEMKMKAIISGGEEAWKVAPLLKEKNVPVILNTTLGLPRREDDNYDAMYETASKLALGGVRFCISTGDNGAHVRDLPYHAGMASAFGLSRSEALKAITIYPAQIFGVADRLGSIEVGKLANIVITDGDLLEARTNIRYLFINGRQVPLVSRHTELFEQFKNRRN